MAGTEVSSVIRDILGAFQSGLAISKTSGRRHRRRHSEPSNANEDKRLHDSLSTRPQEIKQAYDQSVVRHGRCFEVGDSTSQTSLAQILFVLNTGLIKLLNLTLARDHKSRPEFRSDLFSLSETAAMDTLNALSELNIRLISSSTLDLDLPGPRERYNADERRRTRPRAQSSSQPLKRPPISPHLRNGGWVRSKSDPSVVSVVASPRTKKNDPKRGPETRSKSAAPSKTTTTAVPETKQEGEPKSPPPRYSQLATKTAPRIRPKPEHLQSKPPNNLVDNFPVTGKELVRHPSMYIVTSDFFDMFPQPSVGRYEPHPEEDDVLPPLPPPKEPLYFDSIMQTSTSAQQGKFTGRGRARPPSMMTFKTTSTKIGEIPEHLWPDRVLTEEEQEETPMPYVIPDMLYTPKKKAGKGLKFWKRERQQKATVEVVGA